MSESWHDIVSPFVERMRNNKRRQSESTTSETTISSGHKHPRLEIKDSLSSDNSDTETASSSSKLTPSQIAIIVEELRMRLRSGKIPSSKRFLTFNDFDGIDLPPGVTRETLKIDLRRYAKEAVMLSTMPISTAIELLHLFLEDGASLCMDPQFPKKPPNAFQMFMKRNARGKFSSDTTTLYRKDSHAAEKMECEKEAHKLLNKYLKQLIAYRDSHPLLTAAHITFLQKTISLTEKLLGKQDKGKSRACKPAERGEPKEKPKTAFELFSITLGNKYSDLDDEKRDKKLKRKYEKLDEAQRHIYESLAGAL